MTSPGYRFVTVTPLYFFTLIQQLLIDDYEGKINVAKSIHRQLYRCLTKTDIKDHDTIKTFLIDGYVLEDGYPKPYCTHNPNHTSM